MSENISVSSGKLSRVLKGIKFILISYCISVALVAVVSALIVYTDIPEHISNPAVKIITFFGVVLSSYLTSRTAQNRGWLCGAWVGGLNIAMLILIGTAIFGNYPFTVSNVVSVLIGCVLGSIGGIIGINSTK
ncbi:MAG: TIGR04086 family membrane protein [Clostridia bacterium]|nr:TIGR04086 family membrane protein [Clostridia bacterium]